MFPFYWFMFPLYNQYYLPSMNWNIYKGNLLSDQSNSQKIVNHAYTAPLYYTVDSNIVKNYYPAKLYITEPLYLMQHNFRNPFFHYNYNQNYYDYNANFGNFQNQRTFQFPEQNYLANNIKNNNGLLSKSSNNVDLIEYASPNRRIDINLPEYEDDLFQSNEKIYKENNKNSNSENYVKDKVYLKESMEIKLQSNEDRNPFKPNNFFHKKLDTNTKSNSLSSNMLSHYSNQDNYSSFLKSRNSSIHSNSSKNVDSLLKNKYNFVEKTNVNEDLMMKPQHLKTDYSTSITTISTNDNVETLYNKFKPDKLINLSYLNGTNITKNDYGKNKSKSNLSEIKIKKNSDIFNVGITSNGIFSVPSLHSRKIKSNNDEKNLLVFYKPFNRTSLTRFKRSSPEKNSMKGGREKDRFIIFSNQDRSPQRKGMVIC